jgi:hypothetical protein
MRKRRLERLESRHRPVRPWVDPFPVAMALFHAIAAEAAAERAGRPFSRLPSPDLGPPSEEVERAMRDADRMAARLEAERKGTRAA